MFKFCLFRGCRIALMLVTLAIIGFISVFYYSPDVGFFEHYVEQKLKANLSAKKVDVSTVKISWDSGPVISLGEVNIDADRLSIQKSQIKLSYSIFHFFRGSFAPELHISGGNLVFDFDAERKQKSQPVDVLTVLSDVRISWIYKQEEQVFEHVNASVLPYATHVFFKSDGVDLYAALDVHQRPTLLRLKMTDFSGLPKSWRVYVNGLKTLDLNIQDDSDTTWAWQLKTRADKGLVAIDEIHFKLPFHQLDAQGTIQFKATDAVSLASFQAHDLHWQDGDNFGDFKLKWLNDSLHIDALDGSTTMPMLWSWLWMLGDEEWHDWLNSMHYGRLKDVRAELDLHWATPLISTPNHQDIMDMTYHVTTKAMDADISLGLAGDSLYHAYADVEIDENQLQAKVSKAELNKDMGSVSGDYKITWHTLIMDVHAKGHVDVGKLHHWLDPESAKALHWGQAPASARLEMAWNARKTEPDKTIIHLEPAQKPWLLKPKGIPISVIKGVAVWDFKHGIDLKHLKVNSPWLKGEVSMVLNNDKVWPLQTLHLSGNAPLAKLTDQISLPIVEPKGEAQVNINYERGVWFDDLNLTKARWQNFAGYKKTTAENISFAFKGKSTGPDLLPFQVSQFSSTHPQLSFESEIDVDKDKVDFTFHDVNTPALRGAFRVLVPFNTSFAWGIEAKADFIDQPLFTQYLKSRGGSDSFTRPWSVFADVKRVEWEKSYAEHVHLKFSSDRESVGEITAQQLISGDLKLKNLSANFSINHTGKYDLHLLKAQGSDQTLQASGTVIAQKDGSLKWQGMALMDGQFGTLMRQAELDQLFQDGEITALFLGQGEFKDGEPWWRKMKGDFRLRVDKGRIMEGGTLTHLLAAISLVDLPKYLIFQRGDVISKGLSYDKMQIEADFDANILNIKELAFLSSALDAGGKGKVDLATGKMDVLLVARPWQNIEAIVGHIPLLGTVLTGQDKSFLRKVYHIHGLASDAEVDEVSPEEAGLPRSGLLEDLFSLPSKWFGN